MKYLLAAPLFITGMIGIAQSNTHVDLISCQGNQGSLVNRCAVSQDVVLAEVQPYESEFRVDYRMTCNRNYRGPKSSFTSVFLENGQALNLQYNYEGSGLFVGTGAGPLVLRDIKPIDLQNMQFNDCQLIFTNVNIRPSARVVGEWAAEKAKKRAVRAEYLRLTQEQVKLNTNQIAEQQANLFFRTRQKIGSACLIQRYESDPLYSDVIADLKNNFMASFGDDLSATAEQCASKILPKPSLNGLTCDMFSMEGIHKQLARALSQADRYFYETCGIENNYVDLLTWFQRKQTELARMIVEVEADGLTDIKADLQALLQNIDQAVSSSCSEATCQVVDVTMDN